MDSEQDHEFALQLWLEDLAELENPQKGKQRAGEQTDLEMATNEMRSSILAAQHLLHDRMYATRIGVAMDAESIEVDENDDENDEVDEEDRFTAALDNRNEPASDETDSEGAISDLVHLTEQGTPDASQDPEIAPAEPTSNCDSCLEQRQIFLTNSCNHKCCHTCIRELFLGAIRDEELYPPRCCAEPFPAETAKQVLGNNELDNFNQKATEYTAENGVYCAEPGCSTLIPQTAILHDIGACPGCQKETHLPCGALVHPGVDCPLDSTLQNFLSMANTQGWQRCYSCRTMVELHHGCNHMTCRCGKEFCYECGKIWKKMPLSRLARASAHDQGQ